MDRPFEGCGLGNGGGFYRTALPLVEGYRPQDLA